MLHKINLDIFIYLTNFTFSVDTQMDECGLPNWLVSRQSWSNMDTSLIIETIRGSTRSINMIAYYNRSIPSYATYQQRISNKRMGKGRGAMKFNDINGYFNSRESIKPNAIKSRITCHKILQSNITTNNHGAFTRLVAYQKLGW